MLTLFRNRLLLAVASGHFVIDVLNSIVPVMLAVLATSLMLACLLVGVLGSGLFHPIGTASAAAAHPARAGSATALFFFCGQIGLASGPLIAGLLFRSSGALGV